MTGYVEDSQEEIFNSQDDCLLPFIYRPLGAEGAENPEILQQGDVIARTPEITEAIRQAHRYYAEADHYHMFLVITQSCDLVRRNNKFKAPYITIAAIKPMATVVNRDLAACKKRMTRSEFDYLTPSDAKRLKQQIERYVNNTNDEVFFLPASAKHNIREDYLAFLRLTIALRPEHYSVLLQGRVAQLEEVFQAKLGWLTGNIYSRVATPDLSDRGFDDKKVKEHFYEKYLETANIFEISGMQANFLKSEISRIAHQEKRDLTLSEVKDIISNTNPTDVDLLCKKIVERLVANRIIPDDDEKILERARTIISNVPEIKTVLARLATQN